MVSRNKRNRKQDQPVTSRIESTRNIGEEMKLVHDALGVRIYTGAQMLWFRIVGESSELFLYSFGELRIKYDRVSCSLARELLVKVGYIKHRFLKKVV